MRRLVRSSAATAQFYTQAPVLASCVLESRAFSAGGSRYIARHVHGISPHTHIRTPHTPCTPRAFSTSVAATMASEGDESKLRELYPPNEPYNTGMSQARAAPGCAERAAASA